MICLSAFVSSTSCDTDIESAGISEPTIEEQNPTIYTAYLQQLLRYRQQPHQVVFGWFDNANKQPASQSQLIGTIPDNLDHIILTYPDSLTANEPKNMRSPRQEKDTHTLYEINFKQFVERYDTPKQAFSEDPANKGKEFKLQLNTFLADSIQYRLSLADRYGYDSIMMNLSAQLPLHMTPMEQDFYLALENDAFGIAKDWKECHSDKMLVLSGIPTFIKDKSVSKLANYIIISAQGITNVGALHYLINKAMADDVPTSKFVSMVDLYSLDKTDVKIGYQGKISAAISAVRVVAMINEGYQLAGLVLGSINNNYYHAAFTYPVVHQAISVISPSVKKQNIVKGIFLKYIPFAAVAFLLAACQSNGEKNFANRGFIDETSMLTETIIKGNVAPLIRMFHVTLACPAQTTVSITAHVSTVLVSTYNQACYANAELLPDICYRVDVDKMNIVEDAIKSTEAGFSFLDLGGLGRSKLYVLPVKTESNAVELLNTAKRYCFVFRAGALISTVADIEKNYLGISPQATPDRVSRMKKATLEALIYPHEFGKLISTVMGVEDAFLVRIGDVGVPGDQIQITTHDGNFTSAKLQLETNKWQHVAMTYSQATQEMKACVSGRIVTEIKMQCVPNLVGNGFDRGFLVGRSYDGNCWLSGYIPEACIWDVIRTPEQIAGNIYAVDSKTPGLVVYWEFDDNSSLEVKDHTGNGNTLKANDKLKWKTASLPEKK